MVGLVRQEERAAARELALQRAGVELVAAAGREQVNEAAISSVLALVERPVDVRLVLLTGDGALVAASSADDGEWPLSKTATAWLRESAGTSRQVALAGLPEDVRNQLRLHDGRTVLLLPLTVREATRGLLVLCSPFAVPARAGRFARVARLAGVARPRGSLPGRGPPPPSERGPVPVARRSLERPHHRPRRPRHRHVPEPVGRARARLPGRRDRRARTSRGCWPSPTDRGWRRSLPV